MLETNGGVFIEHISHDTCGSSDGLAVYRSEDWIHTGYCFSCQTWVSDPYGEKDGQSKGKSNLVIKVRSQADIQSELDTISQYPMLALTDRGIDASVAAYYGVRATVSQSDGVSIAEHYYPYYKDGRLSGYKKRIVANKDFYAVGDLKGVELFGQSQAKDAGTKKLFITEGECDAMALYQAITTIDAGTQYAQYKPAVVSIVGGAGSAVKNLSQNMLFVSQFDEIILVFDNDEAGKSAVKDVIALFPPNRVKVADLSPYKDANDMLRLGKLKELKIQCVFRASILRPSGIVTVGDIWDEARSQPKWGISWPWPSLTKLTFGIRRKEIIGIGAGVGVGKTNYWHELIEHLTITHGLKVGAFLLEEAPGKTFKMVAGKFAKTKFHDPSVPFNQDALDQALLGLSDKLIAYRHEGSRNWEDIKHSIRHMVLVEGCKDIILDPMSALTAHVSSAEANDLLNTIMSELSGMVHQLDFTLYYSSHLNPPQSGAPHEEGGRVKEYQFTGSRAMIKWSNYIFGLERNKQSDDEIIKNTTTFRLLKDREHGHTGTFLIFYDKNTGSFLEPKAPEPIEGVNY